MDEQYYESLIKNISNTEIDESDKEEFFASFDIVKNEATNPNVLNLIISNADHPNFIKDMFMRMNISSSNVDKVIEFFRQREYISSNDEILDWLINLDSEIFHNILYYFKPLILGNSDRTNKKYFPIYNYSIIRIMDYCLKHANFEKFGICTERLEPWSLEAYWNARQDLIESCINNYRNNLDFFFIFNYKSSDIVKKYLTEADVPNLTFATCQMLISQNLLPMELINCNSFFDVFKSFSLDQQIIIAELLEGYDYPSELINQLHRLFNKEKVDKIGNKKIVFITNNILEVSPQKLKQLYNEIKNSSYFKKFDIEKDDFWLFINDILKKSEELKYPESLSEYSYNKLKELYEKCYRYATESIVSSLYPLTNLNQRITYIDVEKYNILCRVQTFYDLRDLNESFKERTFCGFSILTQDNFTHYPGAILHGYYSGLTPDMIAHIYPYDSLSRSWAKYRKDLSEEPNMLLDIDDLNELTYAYKTYNQLCVKTKTKENKILTRDAIICIGDADDKSLEYSEEHNSNVLVLRKGSNTIDYTRDIYSHLQ